MSNDPNESKKASPNKTENQMMSTSKIDGFDSQATNQNKQSIDNMGTSGFEPIGGGSDGHIEQLNG